MMSSHLLLTCAIVLGGGPNLTSAIYSHLEVDYLREAIDRIGHASSGTMRSASA